ncbi:RNA-guided endonuclease InsQ/TnpB family protein [Coleofasciculus sp.]|uniref:RNA-guided endonuclease InsQ/TnpB family protein n=1 Tax=Coleofasciculus sp. TaxID=3100458 RepID=UPI0039F9B730
MIISYQYRLKPNYEQRSRLTRWLDMLRYQYNWLLAQRFDWWENNRNSVNACPLVCSIAQPKEQPEYYGQKRSLVQLKQERPWYQDIHAHVLQDVVKRVNLAFQRFLKGDSNGKRSGKPRFKGKNRYRTMAFPSIKARRKLNQRIARLHQRIALQRKQWHYELAGKLLDKADVIFVEDLKVSNMARRNKPKQDEEGNFLPNGQSQKSGLNKSFADAGIAGFLNEILPYKAEKAGKQVIKVNPAGTSEHCAICLNRVSKTLSDRWHECPHCGASMPRDLCSGILIKKVGLGIASLKNAKSRKRDGEARTLSEG